MARTFLTAALVIATAHSGRGQQPPAPTLSPQQKPLAPSPQPGELHPSPRQNPPAPSPHQNPPLPSPQPSALTPDFSAPAANVGPSSVPSAAPTVTPLTRDEAVRLALAQASIFQQARLNELIAAEDVRQAQAAFLPRLVIPSSLIYNSPAPVVTPPGTLRPEAFSFISANAIREYTGLVGAAGEIDLAGRLRATLRRNVALLEAAHAGTEVARRALVLAVDETYYSLAVAAARRHSAEMSLAAAQEFERITELLLNAGEVAQVDVVRARLQTATRRDELERARADEAVAADGLRLLIGYDFTAPIATTDLMTSLPDITELDRFTTETISRRPELAQFDAQRRATEQEMRVARAERRPQLLYSINGGFDSDSLHASPLREHTGVLASVSLTIPLFDWGASKSRERQARLREQLVESERTVALRRFTEQFSSARAQALSAATRVQLARASVVDAERNLQTSIERYRAGEAPVLEVTDAQSTLAAQRAALYQALFDYQIARTRLAQAAGQ